MCSGRILALLGSFYSPYQHVHIAKRTKRIAQELSEIYPLGVPPPGALPATALYLPFGAWEIAKKRPSRLD